MNDLQKKDGHNPKDPEINGGNSNEASRLRYNKLEVYLLLLYQAYLKKETLLEPEIKAALWRMVQFKEDFPMRIRMLQLEFLSYETDNFDEEWDEVKDSLFPVKDDELLDSLSVGQKNQILEYKKSIFELLGDAD